MFAADLTTELLGLGGRPGRKRALVAGALLLSLALAVAGFVVLFRHAA